MPSPPHSLPNNGRPVSPAHSDFALSTSALGSGSGNGVAGGSNLGPHRAMFESREVVTGAQLLSPAPDFVIVGGPGLVRAVLLSNRVHALTVDTVSIIAVWDIVWAVCVGQFLREDVLLTANVNNNRSGGGDSAGAGAGSGGSITSRHKDKGLSVCSLHKALDLVREHIDGAAFVVPWSSIDTAMGMLNVHPNEYAFGAELYADELRLPPDHMLPTGIGPNDMQSVFFLCFWS